MTNNELLQDIVQVVTLNAPIEKVWATVSTSEGIATWFMPNDFRPEVGSEFHVQSPFGPSPCKVLEINPPNKLSFSWDVSGWIVSFELKEVNGKTEFTLTHGGWGKAEEIVPKAQQNQETIRKNMNMGWEKIVHERLRNAVEQ
jgi:uncharacterized protein YndB with AHSA1/START domain